MDPRVAIGIDLGATNIKGVLVDDQGEIIEQVRAETNETDERHWKQTVSDVVRTFQSKMRIDAMGLSAPGLADAANQCITIMPGRLSGLENFNWTNLIGQRVYVLNDAHAAMMAEASFGAAKGLQHAVLLTLGTGVGGGILIDGQLYQGLNQMAGHLGHISTDALSEKLDVTNMPGSIEEAIGNVTLPERSNGKYQSTEALVKDYVNGVAFAKTVWLESVRKLAVTIASLVNILSPEAVILSGGITQAGEALLKPLEAFRAKYEWRPGGNTIPVKLAHFTDQAGAMGAAGFALSKLN